MIDIECYYYKKSGKYYTHAKERFPVDIFKGCVYPRDYGKRLLEMKALPGLESGTWEHSFTVHVEDKYPELVVQ